MNRKTILISVISHIAFIGAFSFSFGQKLPTANYASVDFLGRVLFDSQVTEPDNTQVNAFRNRISNQSLSRYYLSYIRNIQGASNERIVYTVVKPQATLRINTNNAPAVKIDDKAVDKEPVAIIFHPLLPYSFGLYFKDRQVAHVELEFKIGSYEEKKPIMVKRKVSSGNLEVDLLTMRYIGHYLFIQQSNFSPNNWHTVKIDLSAKSDYQY